MNAGRGRLTVDEKLARDWCRNRDPSPSHRSTDVHQGGLHGSATRASETRIMSAE